MVYTAPFRNRPLCLSPASLPEALSASKLHPSLPPQRNALRPPTARAEIGVGLTAFGVIFFFLGILFFFDKGLLSMGNVRAPSAAANTPALAARPSSRPHPRRARAPAVVRRSCGSRRRRCEADGGGARALQAGRRKPLLSPCLSAAFTPLTTPTLPPRGQLLFLSGVTTTIGGKATLRFFTKKRNYKARALQGTWGQPSRRPLLRRRPCTRCSLRLRLLPGDRSRALLRWPRFASLQNVTSTSRTRAPPAGDRVLLPRVRPGYHRVGDDGDAARDVRAPAAVQARPLAAPPTYKQRPSSPSDEGKTRKRRLPPPHPPPPPAPPTSRRDFLPTAMPFLRKIPVIGYFFQIPAVKSARTRPRLFSFSPRAGTADDSPPLCSRAPARPFPSDLNDRFSRPRVCFNAAVLDKVGGEGQAPRVMILPSFPAVAPGGGGGSGRSTAAGWRAEEPPLGPRHTACCHYLVLPVAFRHLISSVSSSAYPARPL